ncbi:early growth response protein 4 [Sphaerodactylus townsendi]|uniref:early growth response protein 4 n=1 Tax=Sphaerodactylus townsendi TaxID=933632 RepID=UPI002027015A|nr:early growth response protein 4 [Sphaerodactylus townsendi]
MGSLGRAQLNARQQALPHMEFHSSSGPFEEPAVQSWTQFIYLPHHTLIFTAKLTDGGLLTHHIIANMFCKYSTYMFPCSITEATEGSQHEMEAPGCGGRCEADIKSGAAAAGLLAYRHGQENPQLPAGPSDPRGPQERRTCPLSRQPPPRRGTCAQPSWLCLGGTLSEPSGASSGIPPCLPPNPGPLLRLDMLNLMDFSHQDPLKAADAQISGAGQVGQVLTEQPRQETSDFLPGDFMGATMNPDIGGYYSFAGQPSPPLSYTGSFFIKTEQCPNQESLFNLMSGILGLSPFPEGPQRQQTDAAYSVPKALQNQQDPYSACQPELNISVQPSLADQDYPNFSSPDSIQPVQTSPHVGEVSQCLFNNKLLDSKQDIKLSLLSPSLDKFKAPCSHWEPLHPPQSYLPTEYPSAETFHGLETGQAMQLGTKTENALSISCQAELDNLSGQVGSFGHGLDFGCQSETYPSRGQLPGDFAETKMPNLLPQLIQEFESSLSQPEVLANLGNPNEPRLQAGDSTSLVSLTDFSLALSAVPLAGALGPGNFGIQAELKKKPRRGKCPSKRCCSRPHEKAFTCPSSICIRA